MPQNNSNLILAMALSILVIIGWNYFFATPQYQKEHSAQLAQQQGQPVQHAPGSPSALPPRSPNAPPQGGPANQSPQAILTRDAALAETTRVPLDSTALSGSINLTGARIDDVSLKDYRETPNPKSPNIILLSPSSAPTPYYAEMGYVSATADLQLPGATTVWKSDGGKLTSETPVNLTADNGHGLIFHRRIAVDDHYMFTVTDTIENKTGAAVTLYPYSLVTRHGKPKTSGYSVLHEGMVGRFSHRSGHNRGGRFGHCDLARLRRRQGHAATRLLSERPRHQALRTDDRLGLVLLHHQADVLAAR
jgi:YidC/Oxa1 family membrane protein insertase